MLILVISEVIKYMKIVRKEKKKCTFCGKSITVSITNDGWGTSKHKCKQGKLASDINKSLKTKI